MSEKHNYDPFWKKIVFIAGVEIRENILTRHKADSSWKNIKMELTLVKKESKVAQFTDIFLYVCSVYKNVGVELKK